MVPSVPETDQVRKECCRSELVARRFSEVSKKKVSREEQMRSGGETIHSLLQSQSPIQSPIAQRRLIINVSTFSTSQRLNEEQTAVRKKIIIEPQKGGSGDENINPVIHVKESRVNSASPAVSAVVLLVKLITIGVPPPRKIAECRPVSSWIANFRSGNHGAA
jgi:hypothetical protein